MNDRTDPARDTEGRAAALAAFDRRDDAADLVVPAEETESGTDPARAAGASLVTSLRFDHGGLTLEVRVHARGRRHTVHGLLSGDADQADLRVRRPGRTDRARVGTDGRFRVTDLSRGPVSLEVRRHGRPVVVTDWFTI